MLPWLREKITLRRQRWLRSRNEETKLNQNDVQDDTKTESSSSNEHLLHLKFIAPHFSPLIIIIQVSILDSGLQIKEKILKKLESMQNPSPSKSFPNDVHKLHLVRSITRKIFHNFDSVGGSNIKNMEEFIIKIKRSDEHVNAILHVQNQHGPSEKDIFSRTRYYPVVNSSVSTGLSMTLDSAFLQGDLQHDLRKILSEIAKYSAYILGSLPYAEKLILFYRQKILYNLNNQQDIVKILMDMGFSHKNVIRALRLQGNNYTLALDWLVENVSKENDKEEEEEIQSSTIDETLNLSCESVDENCDDPAHRRFSSANSIFYSKHKAISIKDRVEGLLEIVRYYSEKNEEPVTKADTINSLINMGFAIEEIERALQISNNQTTAACEWLLANSSSNSHNSNALRESIFVESHILKILLNTPQIQFSLSSPKFFIAYCSLLENYSSLNVFFNDIESQSLLQFILRTYHEEKIYFHTFDKLSSSTVVTTQSSSTT